MKKILTLVLILTLSNSIIYSQNSVKIQELASLDSSSVNIVLGRQAIVMDNDQVIHLFYGKWGLTVDSVLVFTSNDLGVNWNGPEIVSIYSHSATYTREHIYDISASVDGDNDIHLVYRYDGPPNYYSSYYNAYPSTHINYVEKIEGVWTTSVNVINDESVQSLQGNAYTVCYLNYSQLLNYKNVMHYIAYDYAWFATKYNIVYSNNSTGSWPGAEALYTYNLGAIDNIILNAPAMVVNNDTLFTVWYHRHDCTLETKMFNGTEWSTVNTIFNDKYFSPQSASYVVHTGSPQQNDTRAVTAMLRSIDDYNELIVLNKKRNQAWQVDTTQLAEYYYSVEPSMYLDTTYLYLYRNSVNIGGSILKYTETDGFLDPIPMSTEDDTELLLDIKSLSDASLPFAFIVRTEDDINILKIGKVNDLPIISGTETINLSTNLSLAQNYPNPFTAITSIKYSLPEASHIKLQVFDILGSKVAELVNSNQSPGDYSVQFSADKLPSGTYFYQLEVGNQKVVKKMFVLK